MNARQVLDVAASEEDWTTTVLDCALRNRWEYYHTYDSRRSNPGWPDWVFCRPPRLVLAELKKERGKLSPAQEFWRSLLAACPGVEMYVWRPHDWEEVQAVLAAAPGHEQAKPYRAAGGAAPLEPPARGA